MSTSSSCSDHCCKPGACAAAAFRCILPPIPLYPAPMTDQQHSPYKSTGGLQRVFRAWRYSLQGLGAALKYEAAFRQEVALVIILVPAAVWLGRDATEVLLLLFSMLLVLVAELLNSAVEALADALSVETHPLLGRAKDLGSAAVMLSLLFSAGLWIHVLAGRLLA